MTLASPPQITLWIAAAATEGAAMKAAGLQLAMQLRQGGGPARVALQSLAPGALPEGGGPHAAVLSFSGELARSPEPIAAVRARWTARVGQLQRSGLPCVLCTVFRHTGARMPGHPDPLAERILRLNLLAAQLSHDTGASVADVDRALCELGARALRADFRIGEGLAAGLAGHTIARTLMMEALEGQLPAPALDRAVAALGTVHSFIQRIPRQR